MLQRSQLADQRAELGRRGNQQADLVGGEFARLRRLQHEHSLKRPTVDERGAQKRLIRFLARLRKELEAWMMRRIGVSSRTHLFGN